MAEALLGRRLAGLGAAASVRSRGLLSDGQPSPPEVVAVMATYGLDVSAHRSRQVTTGDLESADLTLAMAREHLRHAVVAVPSAWPSAFTLKELVRRGEEIGHRSAGESLADWLARAHDGRQRAALLGDSPDDDIADPIGGPPHGYTETAAMLSQLLNRLVELGWESVGPER